MTANSLKRVPQPQTRGQLQQKYIAGVVYDLIAEQGIENLTMRQVADVAKVSLGTITYHFRSKEALIAAALESGYELPDDWDQYKGSPAAQLRRIALSYALQSPKERWWRFWINYVAMSTRDPEIQAIQTKRFDRQRRFWIKLFTEGKELGEIRDDIPIEETVDRMLVEVHGHIILQLVKPSPRMRMNAREAINRMIDETLVKP
ncbi:TetR family transcriptional regulator [Bradyrhizobium pachyrhizi]|uniref:TetR family transcriptional regulator n=1 Tax=Bradyrhizobium pachyrhizi TaxID=280333 RepID=A0A844SM89_9BRAD|nr:TetR/AcrR family transcriptional regulator [Bradyrhizobium pachyrhizi]MVT63580.1 TetR family transcriptional regulator [Bradyrhizobium pachyrhizi]